MSRLVRIILALAAAALMAVAPLTGCSVVEGAVEEAAHQASHAASSGTHDAAEDNADHTATKDDSAGHSQEISGSHSKGHHTDYCFRSKKLLNQHYNKHGRSMGFKSAADYEQAASDVANNPKALHKIEREDGDDVYYVEKTNEFVVVSTDGYLRTYFNPESGIRYFNKQ